MSLVSLNQQPAVELTVDEIVWSLPSLREFGQAVVRVSPRSPAFTAEHLPLRGSAHRGGFLVTIAPGRGLPLWQGIADPPRVTAAGAQVTAREIGIVTTLYAVGWRSFTAGAASVLSSGEALLTWNTPNEGNLTAGALARLATFDALMDKAAAFVVPGTFVEAAPTVPNWEFAGEPLIDHLTRLMDLTGSEWSIDTGLRLNWRPPTGALYPYTLMEGGDVEAPTRDDVPADEVGLVSARSQDGRVERAFDTELSAESLLAGEAWLSVSGGSLSEAARVELQRRRFPTATYEVGVLRERRT